MKPYLLTCLLLLTSLLAVGQTQVQITVNVLPPYSAYLQDYATAGQQVQIIIRNVTTTPLEVRLLGQVTGDNGLLIQTLPNYRPPVPLRLGAGETRLLSRPELEGLFDLNQVDVQGIDKRQLYQGRPLPEGSYQLCVQAFDNRTSRPLSAGFPLGCSPFFTVRPVEPPILVSPLCDTEVRPMVPQALVFTWTPPAGVSPAQVQYTFRLVELPLQNADPNVFIDAVNLPPSGVEVKNVPASTLLYGPNFLPLKVGKRYAWRVQAIDKSRKLNFLNDGKSPVCAFTYGEVENQRVAPSLTLGNLQVIRPKKCADTVSAGQGNDLLLAWQLPDSVENKLMTAALQGLNPTQKELLTKNKALLLNQFPGAYYQLQLKTDKAALNRQLKTPFFQQEFDSLALTPGKTYSFSVELVLPPAVRQKAGLSTAKIQTNCSFKLLRKDVQNAGQLLVKGILAYRFPSKNQSIRLPNVRVRLYYATAKPFISTQEVATSVETNSQGEFTFTVKDYLKHVKAAYTGDPADTNRFFSLKVESPYLEQPTEKLRLPIGTPQTHTLPAVTLLARGYNLTVKTQKTYANWPKNQVSDKKLDGQLVLIFRKASPVKEGIPPVEGMVDRNGLAVLLASTDMAGTATPTQPVSEVLGQGGTGALQNGLPPNGSSGNGNGSTNSLFNGSSKHFYQNVYDENSAPAYTEEEARQELKKRGYHYVSTGTLKSENGQPVARFSQLFYGYAKGNDSYYIYCPNLDQTPEEAVPFTFLFSTNASNKKKIDPNKANEKLLTFDIVAKAAPVASFKGRLLYKYPDPVDPAIPNSPPNVPKPLANVKVKLMLTYVIKNPVVTGSLDGHNETGKGSYVLDPAYVTAAIDPTKDHLRTLGMALTDKSGNFSVDLALDKPYELKLVKKGFSQTIGGGEFKTNIQGDVYRMLRVVVDNPYYSSPYLDFGDDPAEKLQPLKNHDLGTLTAGVLSYGLSASCVSANVPNQAMGANKALQKIDVYILRPVEGAAAADDPMAPPYDEGQNLNQVFQDKSGKQYRVVGKGQTDGQGVARFNRLLTGSQYVFAAIANLTGQAATKDKVVGIEETIGHSGINLMTYEPYIPKIPWFVNEFPYVKRTNTYDLKPAQPRVTVRVVDKNNPTQGIEGFTVVLDGVLNLNGNVPWKVTGKTDAQGYCTIAGLPDLKSAKLAIAKKGWLGGPNQNQATLSITIPGGLPIGSNYYEDKITFSANALVQGRVLSADTKQPVMAYVQVGEKGTIVETNADGTFSAPTPYNPGGFPTGDKILIQPKNAIYFPEEKNQTAFKANGVKYFQEAGDILVYERAHRIRFNVFKKGSISVAIEGATAYLLGDKNQPIGLEPGKPFLSTLQGLIEGRFKNVSVQNLYLEIRAKGCVPKTVAFTNSESKQPVNLGNFYLDPAETLEGTVVLRDRYGKETPHPGAEVYLNAGIGTEVFTTKSNQLGAFKLEVPMALKGQKVILHATKAAPEGSVTYVGDEATVAIPAAIGAKAAPVKLVLTTFDKFQIADIWGFPVTVSKLEEKNGQVRAWGEVLLADNAFGPFRAMDPDLKITFNNVAFVPDPANPKRGIPQANDVTLGIGELAKAAYFDAAGKTPFYNVKLWGTGGAGGMLTISRSGQTGKGFVRARAQVVDNSFSFPSSLLSYTPNQFFLADPDAPGAKASQPTVLAFNAMGQGVRRDGFTISQSDGKALDLSLIQFKASSQPQKSRLMGPEIWIGPDVQCVIPDAQPGKFTVSVEKIVLKNNTIDPQGGNGPLTFKLGGKWSVEVNDWTLDYKQGGFYYNSLSFLSGTFSAPVNGAGMSVGNGPVGLNGNGGNSGSSAPAASAKPKARIVTGKIDIPLSEFVLRPDRLVMTPQTKGTIPLAGVADLTLLGEAKFGYDTKTGSDQAGHWSVVVVPPAGGGPAARLGKGQLEGLSSDLDFNVLSLLDNGEDVLSFGGKAAQNIRYYDLIDFQPASIDTGEDYLALVGGMNLNIPRIEKNKFVRMVYTAQNKAKGPSLAFKDPLSFEGKGYVQFRNKLDKSNNPDIQLKNGIMVVRGTVEEPGELKPLDVLLVHTKTFTRITHNRTFTNVDDLKLEATLDKPDWQYVNQQVPVSGDKKFDKIQCSMRVEGNDWGLLTFSGEPLNFEGLNTGRIPFTVHGEIVANPEKVGVQGMDFGGATMSLVYELDKARLTGTVIIPKLPLEGGMNFAGAAQVRLDGNGFYFASSGQVSNVPIIVPVTLKAGIMMGYYSSKDFKDANEVLFQYTHKKGFPCSFGNNVFKGFFLTGEIPVPVIDGLGVDVDLGIASAGLGLQAYIDGYFFGNYDASVWKLGAGASANIRAYAYASIPALTVSGEVTTAGALDMAVGFNSQTKELDLPYDYKLSSSLKIKGELDLGITKPSAELPFGFCFSLGGKVGINPFENIGPNPDFALSDAGCSTVCK